MSLNHSPQIVTRGLICLLDPANPKCWNGTSTTIISLINNNVNTINNGPYGYDTSTYSVPIITLNNGLLSTATSTASITLSNIDYNALALSNNFTIMFAAKKNYYGYGGNNNGNTEIFAGAGTGYTFGWRISEVSQSPVQPISTGAAFTNTHYWGFEMTDVGGFTINVADTVNYSRMCICAMSVDASKMLGFVNGNTAQVANNGGYVPNGNNYGQISFTGAGAGSFNGLLGFFMIYNRALTLTEIQQNFNAMRGRYNL